MSDPSAAAPEIASRPTQVFVASPIGSPGTDVHREALTTLDYIIRKALAPPTWHVLRADLESSPDSIGQGVVRRIIESDLIVVDLTNHNPNVFYELAIAHCYRRPVVLIATVGTSIPFDVADQRTIFYDLTSPKSVYAAQDQLLEAAKVALDNPELLVTPLTNMQRLSEITTKIESGDSDQLTRVLEDVASRLSRIERRLPDRTTPPEIVTGWVSREGGSATVHVGEPIRARATTLSDDTEVQELLKSLRNAIGAPKNDENDDTETDKD